MRETEILVGADRDQFLEVLKDWRFTNIVVWEVDARRQLDAHLPGLSQQYVAELVYDHLCGGGNLVRVTEDREHWCEKGWAYYYETVLEIDGQEIYVEMRFDQRRPDWPKILMVHLHPPGSHFPVAKDPSERNDAHP
jgi:hypothetical protein